MTKILLTGVGAVTSLGIGRDAVLAALSEGRTGVGPLTLFDPPGACEHASEVGAYDWQDYLQSKQTFADRCTELLVGAAKLALTDAGMGVPLPEDAEPVGFCFGTCWGCMDAAERFYEPVAGGKGNRASSLVFSHSYPNCPTSLVAIEFGLRGYSSSFAGDPDAGKWALRDGVDALRRGTARRVLVGASDALSLARLAHLEAEGLLPDTRDASETPGSHEIDVQSLPREGSICFLLEREDASRERGAEPKAEVMEEERAEEYSPNASPTAASFDVYTELLAGLVLDRTGSRENAAAGSARAGFRLARYA